MTETNALPPNVVVMLEQGVDSATLLECQVRVFAPELRGFELLVRNFWRVHAQNVNDTQYFITEDDFTTYCVRLLPALMHLTHNDHYRVLQLPTESPTKILNAWYYETQQLPRWIFDVCREVTRIMVSEDFVFIPYLPLDQKTNYSTLSGVGLTPAHTQAVMTAFKKSITDQNDFRGYVNEKPLPALLTVFTGKGIHFSGLLKQWRVEAMIALRTLRQGTPILVTPDINWIRKATNDITGNFDILFRPVDVVPALVDQHPQVAEVDVSIALQANVNQMLIDRDCKLNIAAQGAKENFVYCIYPNTPAATNAWFERSLEAHKKSPGVPTAQAIEVVHRYMIKYSIRFPDDLYHSKTPPQDDNRSKQSTQQYRGKGRKPRPKT